MMLLRCCVRGENVVPGFQRLMAFPLVFLFLFQLPSDAQQQQTQPADICTPERFENRVSYYLVQRCFDENDVMQLRRAIERQQLDFDGVNRTTADEMARLLGIDGAALNQILLLVDTSETNIDNQAVRLAESLAYYKELQRELDRLIGGGDGDSVYADIAAAVTRGDWTEASKAALIVETRALSAKQQANDGADGALHSEQAATAEALHSEQAATAEALIGHINLVRANFLAAARHFGTAADLAGDAPDRAQFFREAAADALVAAARRNWNELILQDAIDMYRRLLDVRPGRTMPDLWARTQDRLGSAILLLGAGRRSVPLVTGAVAAFEAAVRVRAGDFDKGEWVKIASNLADALAQLGNMQGEPRDLQDAASTYRQILTAVDFDRAPARWVESQTNLGNTLWALGRLQRDNAALREAVAVFGEALTGLSRERQPRDWGATQNNIGAAYFLLAESDDGVEYAANAVNAFEASLDAYRSASAVYFISGVRRNLAGARALLQQRRAANAPVHESPAPQSPPVQ